MAAPPFNKPEIIPVKTIIGMPGIFFKENSRQSMMVKAIITIAVPARIGPEETLERR